MTIAMRPIHGIIFDFDNTLVNSDRAYDVGLRTVGLSPGDSRYAAARRRVKERLGAGNTQSHHRLLYFKELWPDMPPKQLLNTHLAYEQAVAADVGCQWHELRRRDLFALWRQRYRMVILTNETTRMQLAKWHACDPEGILFDGLVSSEEVGVEKPHPDMFGAACDVLGLAPKNCAMVGDSWTDDIAPARKLGMAAWHTAEFSSAHSSTRRYDTIDTLRTLQELDAHLVAAYCPDADVKASPE